MAKAAAKAAAKALAASNDTEARVLAAFNKGASKGQGKGKGKDKGKGADFKQVPCWFFNRHPNGCTKEAANCTHKHIKVSTAEAALLCKPGSKPGTGDGAGARQPSPGKGGKGDKSAFETTIGQ